MDKEAIAGSEILVSSIIWQIKTLSRRLIAAAAPTLQKTAYKKLPS
jgi:hypothetical protein